MSKSSKVQIRTERPFLTIGIASYNYAQYLVRAFEQIKKQDFRDFEILYCDDGSTDGSPELIQQLIDENPDMQIRLIVGTNAGILANRNRILEHANGKYLMICDADDYMLDDCLGQLCKAASEKDADCVIGGFEEVDESGHCFKRHIPNEKSSKWLFTWHHAQIYKTELIRIHHIRFEELPDDVFYLQQVHLHGGKVAFVTKSLYVWMRHANSTSTNTEVNPDWNPTVIWLKLSNFIARLQMKLPEGEDRQALTYYLYKWFYFNVCDLTVSDWKRLKLDLKSMQRQMEISCPGYRDISYTYRALQTKDTLFARMSVTLCWIAERVGMLALLPFLRTMQKKMRNMGRGHG